MVQDLLAGFFIITEKQYGFGDLVSLSMAAVTADAREGTVEDVTLRVTKLRSTEGEMITIPNGQIVKSSESVARTGRARSSTSRSPRARTSTRSTTCCTGWPRRRWRITSLRELLLDAPQLMGVESIELDTVNLRMVARTLPGKQFEVGRRLRVLVVAALRRAGIVTPADSPPMVEAIVHPATSRGCRGETQGPVEAEEVRAERRAADGPATFGRMRISTAALIVAFIALFWVYQTVQPEPVGSDAADAGRAARLRARPELHLGTADQRAAAQGARRHHDRRRRPRDRRRPDHEPDIADGADADADGAGSRRVGPCAHRPSRRRPDSDVADDERGIGADADHDDRLRRDSLNRPAQFMHRYTGVP